MGKNEVKTMLKEFIEETLGVEKELLKDEATLFGDGEIGLGSIDGLEIISFVDEEFGVDMTGIDKSNFASIESIAEYIVNNRAEE